MDNHTNQDTPEQKPWLKILKNPKVVIGICALILILAFPLYKLWLLDLFHQILECIVHMINDILRVLAPLLVWTVLGMITWHVIIKGQFSSGKKNKH